MAWFGDGLSSLSNLKGQITSFTKEVLSEGIVEETDERTRTLNETSERCVQLQDILRTKDAEISLLRRQNCELQKVVVELNAKPRDSYDWTSLDDDGGGGFFWDPPAVNNRDTHGNPEKSAVLQERLSQASVRIRELEEELKISKANDKRDEITDCHQTAELLRAKQDMLNRIIQIGEKGRGAEKNLKRLPLDETVIINEFRAAISKLDTHEQSSLIRSALKALDGRDAPFNDGSEKCDEDEKSVRPRLESISLLSNSDDSDSHNGIAENGNATTTMEIEELRKKISELQQENQFLTTSLDELDKEHSQALDTILAVKDQLSKKHESLQRAYEQLYVECNEAQTKLDLLESNTSTVAETNNNSISKDDALKGPAEVSNEEPDISTQPNSPEKIQAAVQTIEVVSEDKAIQLEEVRTGSGDDQSILNDLADRVDKILKNSHIEIQDGETIFESIARQYVDANWKKEMLERKLTEVSRELNQTAEIRDSLQIESDDMQSNIESLLLQIEHLKSNLPSIPEASEERVASLETETESMGEEIKRLQTEHETLRIKHCELITTSSVLEGSLRNQDNLEAEVRNTKQQLDIAKQQLDGASKNVENNESMMEDLSQRLHASLEENNQLRKKIDGLEITERQTMEKLRVSDEKSAETTENLVIIEKLKTELECIAKKLEDYRSNSKQLEDNLAVAIDARNELERDVSAISNEKEHLEAELALLRENETKKEDSDLLKHLREQLDSSNREKDDLEYDILNMRKELDKALDELTTMENHVSKSVFENERLQKENHELLDQLASSHHDSMERIELLQTEMSLLTEEHSTCKRDAAVDKSELLKMRQDLRETEDKRQFLENELAATISKLETLHSHSDQAREAEKESVQKELDRLRSLEQQLTIANEKCQHLETELEKFRRVEQELGSMTTKYQSLEVEVENLRSLEKEQLTKTESRCRELEASLASLRCEQQVLEDASRVETDLTESREKLRLSLESAEENAAMARDTIENLSQLVKEKDQEVESLKSVVATNAETKHSEEANALATLKAEREEFVRLVQEKHNTSLQYYAEIQRLAQLLTQQTASLQQAIAERDEKTSSLMEKDAEIHWAQNELQVVRQRLKSLEESQNYGETCGVVEHSVQIAQAAILNEKSNALEAALIQEQSNNRLIQNQLTDSQLRESNAAKELERLRSHLVEMEASYTEEALIAEDNRTELETKLIQAEEKVQNSSTLYTSASIRANQQVETLQQQIALIIQQRDEIQNKLSAADDKVLSHTASLTNLQIVLEQFQRGKETDIRGATEKIQQQLNMSYKEQEDLRNEIVNLRTQLSEAKECLQAASRLSEQFDKKRERIEELNQEVVRLTELVNTADQRIEVAMSSGEGKVDKNLVKNLLIGFLSSSTTDKTSVLRVFSTILEFDEGEKERAGLNHTAANTGWFSGLMGSGGTAPTKDQEASLSAAFVRFLESESKPKPQLPALTISNSPLVRPGHSRQHSTSSSQSGLLLSGVTLPSFPDFVPSRNTGSILKEVLKDS